ncbi:Type II secretory pathway component PulK-like protein [Sphingomonas sp. AP4-R1]|uniref:type II secretion system protein GspK n=1 Tax=Sphingomonas sp. AP4-R1 TaxID=2735134 RepID=UPI001493CE72|nr:type II secretion system protein GspK [Sphingomonas sp. AP4-R1]QJU57676.1 Type II secretory pathway component PulK-like protein [Sphingomonas sp. AP4-R1]
MVLVNVLLLVGLAAAVLAIMVAGDDAGLQRATRMAEAAQAAQIARGGELSAVAALRRDMVQAPDQDDATEPWANIDEKGAAIEGGRFAMTVADATGKLDLNALTRDDPVAKGRLATMAGALGLTPGTAERIAGYLLIAGPVADLAELGAAGLTPGEIAKLAPFATALPLRTSINLNAVPEPLLALLLDNPAAARGLVARRTRNGRLTRDDFSLEQAAIPPGCGFASSFFWSVAEARIGGTSQRLTSLIERRKTEDGKALVQVVARWRGRAPLQAPLIPSRP